MEELSRECLMETLDVFSGLNLHRKNVNCAIMPQFVGLRINMISVIIDKGVYVYTFVFFVCWKAKMPNPGHSHAFCVGTEEDCL